MLERNADSVLWIINVYLVNPNLLYCVREASIQRMVPTICIQLLCVATPQQKIEQKKVKKKKHTNIVKQSHFFYLFWGGYSSEESLFCLLVPFWRFLDHDEPTPMAPLSAWPRSPDLPPAWSVPPVVHGGWIVRAPSIRTIRPSACRCNSAMRGVVKTCENPKESLWKVDGKLWKILSCDRSDRSDDII